MRASLGCHQRRLPVMFLSPSMYNHLSLTDTDLASLATRDHHEMCVEKDYLPRIKGLRRQYHLGIRQPL